MRPARRLAGPLLAAALLLVPAPAVALDVATLQRSLGRHTAHLGTLSGAYVVDLTANTELFARRPDLALAPASNEKLFTTSTALLRYGPDATLMTRAVTAPGARVSTDGVLAGDLFLVGGGDPTLGDAGLREIVSAVKAAGVRKVSGGVVGDESRFDDLRGDYDSGYRPDSELAGRLGGLTWAHGAYDSHGPGHRAAARLQQLLERAHVTFGRRARLGRAGRGGVTLATVHSPPMSTLIAWTNGPSDNFYAETLAKDLGASFGAGGSTTAGVAIIASEMKDFGLSPTIVDGSGLSRIDHTTPRQVETLLAGMAREPVFTQFRRSLPLAGGSGTLLHRMRGTAAAGNCRAKTGTLIGVSSLSGYCYAQNHHWIAFSFIENRVNAGAAKDIEDLMVPVIARYTG